MNESLAHPSIRIRAIEPHDDPSVAAIVRDVLTEFGCTGPGFAIHDDELQQMSRAYPGGRAQFYVVERDGEVVGCGGFGPLAGADASVPTCELRKMYFRPELRGLGVGRRLLTGLLESMREAGYLQCYLETTPHMLAAQKLYRQLGFLRIATALGDTGHCACETRYARGL